MKRWKLEFFGKVQGVGFRPFIYRVAQDYHLTGFVCNEGSFVTVEIQGNLFDLEKFKSEVIQKATKPILIKDLIKTNLENIFDENEFKIIESRHQQILEIPTDVSICKDCRNELQEPQNRRYQYPFINCSACGPRNTILESLPFDRQFTTMSDFKICEKCRHEYQDPHNRRFHTQGICCPDCGPVLELVDRYGNQVQSTSISSELIHKTADLILKGNIVAVKGLGGFQLWCLASNKEVVKKLRDRKNRPDKPFALMVKNFEQAKELCEINEIEKIILESMETPIVLLRKKINLDSKICDLVAPNNQYLGLMLPATAFQLMLLDIINEPVIATSANPSGFPIEFENINARLRLSKIADYFLWNNRRILRPLDDSVVQIIDGHLQTIRLGRGLAPMTLKSKIKWRSALGCGADLKSSLSFSKNQTLIVGPYLGELGSEESLSFYQKQKQMMRSWLQLEEAQEVCDFHPQYFSSILSKSNSKKIQHHHAHLFSCAAEFELSPPAYGIVWDGTGFGLDTKIWGGEIFLWSKNQNQNQDLMQEQKSKTVIQKGSQSVAKIRRAASLLDFHLIGSDRATLDPKRIAFDLLKQSEILDFEKFGFSAQEIEFWGSRFQHPKTSSMGRLFDGIFSILQLFHREYQKPSFEGQFAMNLEYWANCFSGETGRYSFSYSPFSTSDSVVIADWRKMIHEIYKDLVDELSVEEISAKFHRTLIQSAVDFILYDSRKTGVSSIILAGGCFQNRILIEKMILQFRKLGFNVYSPQKIPINDGGISVGQIFGLYNEE